MTATLNPLFSAHQRLATKLAQRYYAKVWKLAGVEELEAAAMFGLWQAASTYDPVHGAKFTTWATRRITGAMTDWLRTAYGIRRQGFAVSARTLSLDRVIEDDGGRLLRLGDTVAARTEPDLTSLCDECERALRHFQPRERMILWWRAEGSVTRRSGTVSA